MPYVYCDPATMKVTNITSKPGTGPAGHVEILVASGHDVLASRPAWKLNTAQDNLEEDLLGLKIRRIKQLAENVTDFISGRYDEAAQMSLLMLAIEGNLKGQTAVRMPYLQSLFDWINDVLALYDVKKNEILALTTRSAIEVYDWSADLEAKDATDPEVDVGIARGLVT